MITSTILISLIANGNAQPAPKDIRFAIQPILYSGKDAKFSKNYEQQIKIQLNEMNQVFRKVTGRTPIILTPKRVKSDLLNKDLFSKQTRSRALIYTEIKPLEKQLTLIFTTDTRYIENFGELGRGYKGVSLISERAAMAPNKPAMDDLKIGSFLRAVGLGMGLILPDLEIAPTVMLMPGDYPEVNFMSHEVQALKNSPWFNESPISKDVPNVDPNDIPNMIRPGTQVQLNNFNYVKGDKAEFFGIRIDPNGNLFNASTTSTMVDLKFANGVTTLTIPNEAPSGYVRFWRGNKSGWTIPIMIID